MDKSFLDTGLNLGMRACSPCWLVNGLDEAMDEAMDNKATRHYDCDSGESMF